MGGVGRVGGGGGGGGRVVGQGRGALFSGVCYPLVVLPTGVLPTGVLPTGVLLFPAGGGGTPVCLACADPAPCMRTAQPTEPSTSRCSRLLDLHS